MSHHDTLQTAEKFLARTGCNFRLVTTSQGASQFNSLTYASTNC